MRQRIIRYCVAALCCGAVAVFVLAQASGALSRLDGSAGQRIDAALSVSRGQAGDFTGWLENRSSTTVTLESATLLPRSGFRTPRLVGLAVESGLNYFTSDRGWPAAGAARYGVTIVPLHGYQLRPGRRAKIFYAVRSQRVGLYAAGGVRVRVRSGGAVAAVPVISLGGICVDVSAKGRCPRAFTNQLDRSMREHES